MPKLFHQRRRNYPSLQLRVRMLDDVFAQQVVETLTGLSARLANAIADLIKSEPKHKPLSDDKLAKLLDQQGIKVARRTVAKYREALGILPSHLRKSFS